MVSCFGRLGKILVCFFQALEIRDLGNRILALLVYGTHTPIEIYSYLIFYEVHSYGTFSEFNNNENRIRKLQERMGTQSFKSVRNIEICSIVFLDQRIYMSVLYIGGICVRYK